MPSGPFIKVFLSSTARDLGRLRGDVPETLDCLDGCNCVRMEQFLERDAASSGAAPITGGGLL